MNDTAYVSRGGEKLAAALDCLALSVSGSVCADLGSHVGGFVDCLLRHGALRVYSVDTAYGTLAWKLRKDPRVIAIERTNAMHVTLPELVNLVTIDVGWTPQARILPNVRHIASPDARVVTLIKPHYEAPTDRLIDGVLPDEAFDETVAVVLSEIAATGWKTVDTTPSPIRGHGGNRELFALLARGEKSMCAALTT